MRIALHTKFRADPIEEYEAGHRKVPEERTAAIRDAGAHEGMICRSGTDLFLVLEVEGYQAMIAELDKPPVNMTWQARMADLLDVVHDCSAQGAGASLPVVWNWDRSGDRVRHRGRPPPCGGPVRPRPGLDQQRRRLGPQRSDFTLADLAPLARTAGVTATELMQTITVPEETSKFLALPPTATWSPGSSAGPT